MRCTQFTNCRRISKIPNFVAMASVLEFHKAIIKTVVENRKESVVRSGTYLLLL